MQARPIREDNRGAYYRPRQRAATGFVNADEKASVPELAPIAAIKLL